MGRLEKGKISSIQNGGKKVDVVPSTTSQAVSFLLTVPESLIGKLSVNQTVIYAEFDDNTGIVLGRMDGKYM